MPNERILPPQKSKKWSYLVRERGKEGRGPPAAFLQSIPTDRPTAFNKTDRPTGRLLLTKRTSPRQLRPNRRRKKPPLAPNADATTDANAPELLAGDASLEPSKRLKHARTPQNRTLLEVITPCSSFHTPTGSTPDGGGRDRSRQPSRRQSRRQSPYQLLHNAPDIGRRDLGRGNRGLLRGCMQKRL